LFPLNSEVASLLIKLFEECKEGKWELLNALLKANYERNPEDKLFGGKVFP
jgi:hypothetical protein